jgi:phospholipid/cholesterol/gamma-HCH transport system ATP-binding protein
MNSAGMNDTHSDPVVSFSGIRLGFGEGDILRDVNFDVSRGETKVLVGESGSGKTLTLKLAAGLLRPESGSVRVLGRVVSAMKERDLLSFRRQIGFVFQEGALFDSLSVADNVAYRLQEDRVDPQEIDERIREALRFVELEDAIDKMPAELSGGMRRRVSIARALVSKPALVLYDSPTAGLDPVTAQTIITLIMRLRDSQGVTSIMATHRLQDAFGLANYSFDSAGERVVRNAADRAARNGHAPTTLVVLREGRVYFQGDSEAIAHSQDGYLKRFLV